MPSDGCGRAAIPLAVRQWYSFHEFEGYLGVSVYSADAGGIERTMISGPMVFAVVGLMASHSGSAGL